MNNYLEYHPQLQYKRKLEAVLEDKLSPEQLLPVVLQEALEITPTDIWVQLTAAKDILDTQAAGLIRKLQDKLPLAPKPVGDLPENSYLIANTLSIEDYIKARTDADVDIINAFETFHAIEMQGVPEAEVLPVILKAAKEAAALQVFVDTHFFGGQAGSLTLEEMQEEEQAKMTIIALDHQKGQSDLAALAEENHIKEFLSRKSVQLAELAESVDITLAQSLNDVYVGVIPDLIRKLAKVHQTLPTLQGIHRARLAKHAATSEEALERHEQLPTEFKMELLQEALDQQKIKLDNRKIIEWVELNESDDVLDPINMVLMDMLEGVNHSNQEADVASADLYRVLEAESLQTNDYMQAFAEKRTIRLMYTLIEEMTQNLDFNAENFDHQLELFIQSFGYDSYVPLMIEHRDGDSD